MKQFEAYLQPDGSIDVISTSNMSHYDLFFGPLLPNTKPYVTDEKNLGELLVALGLAESKSWCRKNNWWRDLDIGYQEITFGKKRFKICILVHAIPESNTVVLLQQGEDNANIGEV